MTQQFHVLVVCSANICRSPATAAGLARAAAESGLPVSTASAGSVALPGRPACDLSMALAGFHEYEHSSRPLTADLIGAADLILALERANSAAVASLDPAARRRTFLLVQAGLVGERITQTLATGTLPQGAPELPTGAVARLRWLVEEMDAARADIPAEVDTEVPDPHVLGYERHPMSAETMRTAVERLAATGELVLRMPGNT